MNQSVFTSVFALPRSVFSAPRSVFALPVMVTLLSGCFSDHEASDTVALSNTAELTSERQSPSGFSIQSVQFVDEYVLAPQEYQGTTVGGLSGVDYWQGDYYLISDDDNRNDSINGPVRFYKAHIALDETGFQQVTITDMIELVDQLDDQGHPVSFGQRAADPEGLRVDPKNGNVIWINEGQIKHGGINPSIREVTNQGGYVRQLVIPEPFMIHSNDENVGPRNNVVFEGISVNRDNSGFWVAMEGPLKQDGEEASLNDTNSPVRISLIDRESGEFTRQFAYELDSVSPREGAETTFHVNGVVDLLEFSQDQFLVLERSYVAGQADGGNDVILYLADARAATDVSGFQALVGATYQTAVKKPLLNFNDIRDQLSQINGQFIVDNLEGMTFGPDLPNGNKSLILVADNNFSLYGKQLNQFILLEVQMN